MKKYLPLESSGCLAAVAFDLGVSHPKCRFYIFPSERSNQIRRLSPPGSEMVKIHDVNPDPFYSAMLLCED